ncbi:MAG: hypothetical protein II715_03815 [Clostridia bacterium]|nr:hypothetical protein [Clostridia bacterium]
MNFFRKTALQILALTLAALTVLAPSARSYAYPVSLLGQVSEVRTEAVRAHIAETRAIARRTRFEGLCAMYVHYQLMAEGVLLKYSPGDAWKEFSKYRDARVTDGGYLVEALPADSYTLEEALTELSSQNGTVRRVMVCFRYGTGPLRRYGHVMYIHAIEDGIVYFSESFDMTVDGVRYRGGTPVSAGIRSFCEKYGSMRFDGVVRFCTPSEMLTSSACGERLSEESETAYRSNDYRMAKGYVCGTFPLETETAGRLDADGNGRISGADCTIIRRAVLRRE